MKKYILALTALLTALCANAQKDPGTFTLYPRIGVTMSELKNDVIYTDASGEWSNYKMEPKYKLGFTLGAEVEYQISTFFAASAGLMYAMQGTAYDDYQTESATSYTKITDLQHTLHYINVPVLAILNIGYTGISLKAGVQAGYLLSAINSNSTVIGSIVDGQYIPDPEKSDSYSGTVTNVFHRFDVSIPVGIAYTYKRFTADLRYSFGLKNVYKYTDDDIKNRSISLTVGYGFEL